MIVVCGEALMDVYDAGPTPAGQALDARIGGSPLNVAIGLARLGRPVTFCGALSTGFLGERLRRALQEEGVDLRAVQRVEAPTSICMVSLDENGVPHYEFNGAAGADRRLTIEVIDRLPPTARALQFGSYAMVVPGVAEAQRALIERFGHGRLIGWDVNVRVTVEPDLSRWRETLRWMRSRVQLLKLSEEDLELLAPGLTAAQAATQWCRQGVSLVVVTRGAEGAVACGETAGLVEVGAPAVTVIDTVGAGDSFQAAMLAWLDEQARLSCAGVAGLDAAALRTMLRFAAHAAASTCTRRGADLPLRHMLFD